MLDAKKHCYGTLLNTNRKAQYSAGLSLQIERPIYADDVILKECITEAGRNRLRVKNPKVSVNRHIHSEQTFNVSV